MNLIIFAILAALFNGWMWMLALGAVAHIFNLPALAIGYWSSVVVALIGNFIFSRLRS